ncbi:hypothetical protein SASPL_152497 [Salvia splendens]|uniref:Nodulin homeobox N-terminal domain-containing protein n=1 Tax=Salvia splendens TaxID=180675 RepID=A0A8X8W3F3_SALSN|nr:hypothetical protein SASPL_152497 [Salvia splendens]
MPSVHPSDIRCRRAVGGTRESTEQLLPSGSHFGLQPYRLHVTVNFVGQPWTSRLRGEICNFLACCIWDVDLEKFARNLPLHLIAEIMVWEREKSTFKYLLCGILHLHSMCDLASRVPKIEQILLEDMKISEQLIDLVYIFKEAAFAAVCVDVKYLQTNDSSRSASPTTEETLNHLWKQCDSSLQFLQPLYQQKMFRECIVNNQVFLDFTLSSD